MNRSDRATRASSWDAAVARVRNDHQLRAAILRSVRSSMAFEGFSLSLDEAEALFDEALNGPPLAYPGKDANRTHRVTRTIVTCELCGAKAAHIYRTKDGRLEFQCAGCGREIVITKEQAA